MINVFVVEESALVRPHLEYAIQANFPCLKKDIYHLGRIRLAATRWAKSLRGLNYEDKLKAQKLQSLEKRRIKKIIYNHIDLEATQLFKLPRRRGLRRSSLRLLQQTGRIRRVVKYWNPLPLAVATVLKQLAFKRKLDTYIYT